MDAAAIGREFKPSGHPIALHVEDVEAARAKLEAQGVEFHAETIDSGVCHMAFFSDPDGNALMLHNRYAPKALSSRRRGGGSECRSAERRWSTVVERSFAAPKQMRGGPLGSGRL